MKKIIAIMLIVSFCFTLFSCDNDTSKEPETTEKYVLPTPVISSDISLPYTSAADFNPYSTTASLNRDLIPVIFEPLFFATSNGKGEAVLASTSKIEDKTVTIKLKNDLKFSDGTELLASHVKKSFENAKASPYYSAQLSNVLDFVIIDNFTIRLSLYSVDLLINNALNFPIAKEKKGEYIGSGKYYVEYFNEKPYLEINKYHRDYSESLNQQIALYDMAGITGPVYPFKANEISVYKNDLSRAEYLNLSSETISVETDSLVYIGVNSHWAGSVTSIATIRQAINMGIDRTVISASSYLGQGSPTATPFKNDFYALDGVERVSLKGDIEKAVKLLEKDGFDKVNSDGIRGNGGINLNVSILVCTENQYKLTVAENFKTALEKLGFSVSINKKDTQEAFLLSLSEGYYSFYVGEVMLTPNCDLDSFFTEGGSFNYGIPADMFSIYSSYKNGEIEIAEFIKNFESYVPFIPLFYRKDFVSVNPNISGIGESYKMYSTVSDWKLNKAN